MSVFETKKQSVSVNQSSDSSSDTSSDHFPDSTVFELPYIDLHQDLTAEEIRYRQTSRSYKFQQLLWDGTGKHPKEQKYLIKLDFFLLSSSMLGYFIKNLNQSNITTAYVNGMDEYYGMDKNQLNYMASLWTLGYVVGQIPSSLILHRISARYYLGMLEICWAVLTFSMIRAKSIYSMYAIRFFLGLLESGYFPGLEYLMGSNYAANEISSRSALFSISGNVAGLVSGPIQLWVLNRFKDSSLQPFQWMFVIDAIISFPVGIYTMLTNPNTPSTTDGWYFSEEDKLVGLERRRRIGAQLNTREKYTWTKVKSFFNTWHIYVFPLLFLCYNNSCAAHSQPTFQSWLKYGLGLGPEKYNIIPSLVTACGIFLSFSFATFHNFIGGKSNHVFVYAFFVPMIVGCCLLSWWKIPRTLHWFSYFLVGAPTAWGQPFIFSWLNRLLIANDMKRNFLLVVTNTLAYVTGAWVPIFVWNTQDKPEYHTGFTYTACLSFVGLLLSVLAWQFTRRDESRYRKRWLSVD